MTLLELVQGMANAIRAKKGTTEKIKTKNFISEIEKLSDEESIYGKILTKSYGSVIGYQSNFVLADGSVFLTNDGNVFITKEE